MPLVIKRKTPRSWVHHSTSKKDRRSSFDSVSKKFSWLPGDTACALGYINNVHPVAYKPCCSVIERLVTRFVPMWEGVLGETVAAYSLPARTHSSYPRVRTKEESWYKELEQSEHENNARMASQRELQTPFLLGLFTPHPNALTVEQRLHIADNC